MGYGFKGSFTLGELPDVAAMAHREIAYVQSVSDPFSGYGFSLRYSSATVHEAKALMIPLSLFAPRNTFIYIDYQTWAGPTDYCGGFAYRAGRKISGSDVEIEEDHESRGLTTLVAYLGPKLVNGIFAPFSRGFFPNT